ncbi:uncharacterized protein [Temnothorax nylanderi]|uniref:uncharacterized protein n=1 Tax=Temnothorax nylanderi TaxID=102681 RepID=UPI003A8757F3
MEERRRNVILAIATVSGHNLLRTAIENLQYEQSSDEDCDRWNQEANALTTRIRCRRNLRHRVTRIEGYVAITINNYTNRQFREHFRVTRNTYENLERILTPELIRRADTGRTTLDVRTQLLSILWLLATPDSFRSVSDRFGISKSMLHDSMRRVVASLNTLADRFIKWPVGDRLDIVKYRFSQTGSLSDVIGAIDGCHVPIPAPKVDSISYRTRKMEYAITLQAVCDADMIFTDCFVGFSGSVHDARIFRNSDLWHAVTESENDFFPNNEIIIGDKAYPILSWCLAPYINRGNMAQAQKNFNQQLSKMRQVIERAFALLKGRFRRLKYLHMSRIDLIPYVILACCVLHNVCLEGCDDDIRDFIEEGLEQDPDNNDNADEEGREVIPDRLPNDQRGVARREYLTALLAQNLP